MFVLLGSATVRASAAAVAPGPPPDLLARIAAAPAHLSGAYTLIEERVQPAWAAVPPNAIAAWRREWTGDFAIRGGEVFFTKTTRLDTFAEQRTRTNPHQTDYLGVGEPLMRVWINPRSSRQPVAVFVDPAGHGPFIHFTEPDYLESLRVGVRPLFFAALGLGLPDRASIASPWTFTGRPPALAWEGPTATTRPYDHPSGARYVWRFAGRDPLADLLSLESEKVITGPDFWASQLIECRDHAEVEGSRLRIPRTVVRTDTLVDRGRSALACTWTLTLGDLSTEPGRSIDRIDQPLPPGTRMAANGGQLQPSTVKPERILDIWPPDKP